MISGTILEIKGLKTELRTDAGMIHAVDGIDLVIPQGKIVGLLGESGCGKTMTALSILNILPPVARIISGRIVFENNQDLVGLNQSALRDIRGKKIAMIFQEPFSCLNPVISVGQQIQDVILTHLNLSPPEVRNKIFSLLEKVNLKPAERFFNSFPHQLSGGQRQRIMIAMAISLNSKILIADEPTSALDVTIQRELLKLLLNLKEELNLSILFITHDLRLLEKIADFVYVMYLGKIVEEGPKSELFALPLHPYTAGLLKSLPDEKQKGLPLSAIKGLPADMLNIPSGCPFHPRCPIAEAKCAVEPQALEQKRPHRKARCWKVV